MAAMPQINLVLDQPKPEVVPSPGKLAIRSQPVVQQKVLQRISVEFRKPEPRPTEILLGTINRCEYRVIKAIPVRLDARKDAVVASWQQVQEFGTGKSTSLACDDLGHTIAELYESLEADESCLGPDLARVWGVLKEHVARRS